MARTPCAKWREWLDSVGRAIITLPRILPERPVHPILIASIFPGRRRKGVPAVGTAPNAGRNCAKGHSSARNVARRCDRGGWMGRRVRTLPRGGPPGIGRPATCSPGSEEWLSVVASGDDGDMQERVLISQWLFGTSIIAATYQFTCIQSR